MKTKILLICPICQKSLPEKRHGNRIYHEECYPTVIHNINHSRYDRIKEICNEATRLDDILMTHFPHSARKNPIEKQVLDIADFNWQFIIRMTKSNENNTIFWIINYGYSFNGKLKNQIIIYYE